MASDEPSLLATGPSELIAFRYAAYDVPFWPSPNSRAGRWNLQGDEATQYWALHPDAAWAEHIRHEGLRTESDLDLVRMPLWMCRFGSMHLVDLRRPDERERHAISEEAILDDDWATCQQLSIYLRAHYRGVISPCAALPERANLTIFGARRAIDWEREPALASAVPAAMVAIGRPPKGLVDRVRRPVAPPPGDRLF